MKRTRCIGGPIDGRRVTAAELRSEVRWAKTITRTDGTVQHRAGDILREGGCYGDVGDQYSRYNSAGGRGPSSVWLHNSLLDMKL